MNRIVAFLVGLVIVAVVIRASTFIVDQRLYAIVFQLGQIKRVVTEPASLPDPAAANVEYRTTAS
jgi:membrane protease subunit HflC